MTLRRAVGDGALGLLVAVLLVLLPTLHLTRTREPVPAGPWRWPGEVPATWPTDSAGAFSSFHESRVAVGLTEIYVGLVTAAVGGDVFEYQRLDFGFPFRAARIDLRMEHRQAAEKSTRVFPALAALERGVLVPPLAALPYRGIAIPLRLLPGPFAMNVALSWITICLLRLASDWIRGRWIRPFLRPSRTA